MTHTVRVIDIIDGTIVDGPGLRTSIYVAGCRHNCPGCHNPQSWDFNAGHDMTVGEIVAHVEEADFNVTLSGGDPMYQAEALAELAARLHEMGKTVWCYTGFSYEEAMADEKMRALLEHIDVLVDGPFIESKRDISLHYKGSANQRIIDVRSSSTGNVILFQE